jgi:hypothetical protein
MVTVTLPVGDVIDPACSPTVAERVTAAPDTALPLESVAAKLAAATAIVTVLVELVLPAKDVSPR